MPGLGTIINVVFIIIGGLAGVLFGNRLSEKSRETLLLANAVCVLFIGIAGALQQMFVLAEGGKQEALVAREQLRGDPAGAEVFHDRRHQAAPLLHRQQLDLLPEGVEQLQIAHRHGITSNLGLWI